METLYFYEKSLKIIRKRQEDIRETIITEQELKDLLEREEKNG